MKIMEIEVPKNERARMRMDEMGSYYMTDGTLRRFEVRSDSGNTYRVDNTSNDETTQDTILQTWQCSCPAGNHHRLCRHVLAVIEHVSREADEAE